MVVNKEALKNGIKFYRQKEENISFKFSGRKDQSRFTQSNTLYGV